MGKHLFQKSTGGNQVRVSISSQKQERGKDAIRLKTKRLLLQTQKTSDEQARTDQQHQGEGDLAHDQQTAQAKGRGVLAEAPHTSFECILRQERCTKGWHQTKESPS